MAKKCDKPQVETGRLIPVKNTVPRRGAQPEYYAVRLEEQDGSCRTWCLYTKSDLRRLKRVRMKFPIPAMKPGRMYYSHYVGSKWSSIVPLVVPEDCERRMPVVAGFRAPKGAAEPSRTVLVNMNRTALRRGIERAADNAGAIPELGRLMGLRD